MRDLILAALVLGLLPVVLARPYVGVLLWTWLGYFNPHKATWGFARQLPFSELTAGATLLGWLFSKEPKLPPRSLTLGLWVAFVLWTILTTVFAQLPEDAQFQLERVLKIQVFAFLVVILTTSWVRLRALIWVTVVSLGFYGFKGGIYVIVTGGSTGRVWGPEGTYIEGNNELALALLMTLPLMLYLYRTTERKLVRQGLLLAMVLVSFSVAGSFSRGAFLAAIALVGFLSWKSKRRIGVMLAGMAILGAVFSVMPNSWFDRIGTIRTYQEDGSAQKRLNTWRFAWNYAVDHPIKGGGYLIFRSQDAYEAYAPRADAGWSQLDAHSVYFQVLAEHGFIGLVLFLLMGISSWRRLGRIVSGKDPPTAESTQYNGPELARMLQGSLLAYAVGGTFLGLAYFDLPYSIVGFSIILSARLMKQAAVNGSSAVPQRSGGGFEGTGTPVPAAREGVERY